MRTSVIASVLLAACGGGGSSASPDAGPVACGKTTVVEVPAGPVLADPAAQLVIGDLDHDGHADVFVRGIDEGTVTGNAVQQWLLRGDGHGALTQSLLADTAYLASRVVGGDLNGDGIADLVTILGVPAAPFAMSVMLAKGDGMFAAPFAAGHATDARVRPIAGGTSLVWVDGTTTLHQGLVQNAAMTESTLATLPMTADSLAVGDIDGDGLRDIAVASSTPGSGLAAVYTKSAAASPLATLPGTVELADLDRDHRTDAIVFANGANKVGIALSRNGVLTAPAFQDAPDSQLRHAIGDVDGNGVPDVIFAEPGGVLEVMFGAGDGTLGPASVITTGTPLATNRSPPIAVGDLDGDQRADVVMADSTGAVTVWLARCVQ